MILGRLLFDRCDRRVTEGPNGAARGGRVSRGESGRRKIGDSCEAGRASVIGSRMKGEPAPAWADLGLGSVLSCDFVSRILLTVLGVQWGFGHSEGPNRGSAPLGQ